jgi:hypothetical protein
VLIPQIRQTRPRADGLNCGTRGRRAQHIRQITNLRRDGRSCLPRGQDRARASPSSATRHQERTGLGQPKRFRVVVALNAPSSAASTRGAVRRPAALLDFASAGWEEERRSPEGKGKGNGTVVAAWRMDGMANWLLASSPGWLAGRAPDAHGKQFQSLDPITP